MSTINDAPPRATVTRTRSRSLSTDLPPIASAPIPVKSSQAINVSSPGGPTSPASPSSALSASLRAFSALSLSPPTTLDSEEFQKAYHHVRSSSFSGAQGRPLHIPIPPNDEPLPGAQAPGMSTSPTSAVSDSPPTPPLSTSPKQLGIGLGKPRATSVKASGLGGVCEKEEIEFDDLGGEQAGITMGESAPAATSPFANGARWGWPQAASSGGPLSSSPPQRRASISGQQAMMAPLGRVVSAGATPSSSSGNKASDGFGLFRRLSVGGFGGKPKPPSPPASNVGGPRSAPPVPAPVAVTPTPAPAPAPAPSLAVPEERPARGRAAGGPKKKRGVSPFGERMLRGLGQA